MEEEQITCNNAEATGVSVTFIIDSGATENLIKENMEKYMNSTGQLKNKIRIKIANGNILSAKKKGIITICSGGIRINIDTLIVPGVVHNIISVKKLVKKNYKVICNEYGTRKMYGKKIWECDLRNELYTFQGKIVHVEEHINICNNSNIWH